MSKNYYNNKKSGKAAFGVTALILAGAFAATYIGLSCAKQSWNPGEWFDKTEQIEEVDTATGGAIIGEVSGSKALKLNTVMLASEEYDEYGVSELAETAYTITVTPDPIDAADTFTWTSSDSTYVTVSATNGGKTCTVSCLKAFPTQITLTCTSTHDSNVSATVTVDYVKRLSSVNLSLAPTKATFNSDSTSHTVTATPVWGTGTITPTNFTVSGGTLKNNLTGLQTTVSREFKGFTDTLATIYYRDLKTANFTFTGTTFSFSTPDSAFVTGSTTRKAGDGTLNKYPTESAARTAYNNSFVTAAQNTTKDGTLTINYSYSYGSVVSDSSSVSIDVEFDVSGLITYASDITVDNPGLIF